MAYCGLACCVCGQNATCSGCRDEGCTGKEWCKNFRCCRERGLNGCWECAEFPCTGSMLDKPRIRAFAEFIKEHGEEEMLNCLERNERAGTIYHYEGQLVGDYDRPGTIEGIKRLIKDGT
ncbi:MAG: DUF3795 domain-containing protein [Methanomassiliicoccus sp.]|nr:DUF3795 domain-containing protein [Methanomassiliicoccus sp.]